MSQYGVLASQHIREMLKLRYIQNADAENINPASLDLSISEEIYRVHGIFLPKPGESIRALLQNTIDARRHTITSPFERGVMYLARCNEILQLPESIYGYCNPKSSTGRNNIHVRVLANCVSRYDAITPAGYSGDLWIVITQKSYPILLEKNERLTQIRFFNRDTRLEEFELEMFMDRDFLIWNQIKKKFIPYSHVKIRDNDGSIILRLDMSQDIIGYECRGSNQILNFSKRNFYVPDMYFTPIKKHGNYIHLEKGVFYILSTREAVRVPPHLACEMSPMDERSGEFRSHYAGFIDPGWGWGRNGEGKGRPLTLEVCPFEDIIIRDGQPIAKIKFERMLEIPDILYDKARSHYTTQSVACLSKHFKQ